MPPKDPNRFPTVLAIQAIRDSRETWLGKNEQAVLLMLVASANYHGTVYTGQDALAKQSKLGSRTVWKALKNLEKHFFLPHTKEEADRLGVPVEIEHGRQHWSTRYHLRNPIARLAARATLETSRLAKSNAQTRKSESPDSQNEQSRVAPVAMEEIREETKKEITDTESRSRVRVESSSVGKATRIPSDWKPSDETAAWCKTKGVDEFHVWESFLNHWRQATTNATSLDWDLKFRNRVLDLLAEDKAPMLLSEHLPQRALERRAASVAINTPDLPRLDLLDDFVPYEKLSPEDQAKARTARVTTPGKPLLTKEEEAAMIEMAKEWGDNPDYMAIIDDLASQKTGSE